MVSGRGLIGPGTNIDNVSWAVGSAAAISAVSGGNPVPFARNL